MQKKESFIIYKSFYAPIKQLNDQQMGQLFRALFEYQINDQEVDPGSEIYMAFQFFKNQFNLDHKKYEAVCEKRKKAADSRWKKEETSGSKSMQMHASDADKENEKEKEKKKNRKGKENERDLINPFSPEFLPLWDRWIEYKREEHQFKYKSIRSEQTALNGLHTMAKGSEEIAAKIMEQSVINGWKGFFILKDQALGNEAKKNIGVSEEYMESLKTRINGGDN